MEQPSLLNTGDPLGCEQSLQRGACLPACAPSGAVHGVSVWERPGRGQESGPQAHRLEGPEAPGKTCETIQRMFKEETSKDIFARKSDGAEQQLYSCGHHSGGKGRHSWSGLTWMGTERSGPHRDCERIWKRQTLGETKQRT